MHSKLVLPVQKAELNAAWQMKSCAHTGTKSTKSANQNTRND